MIFIFFKYMGSNIFYENFVEQTVLNEKNIAL